MNTFAIIANVSGTRITVICAGQTVIYRRGHVRVARIANLAGAEVFVVGIADVSDETGVCFQAPFGLDVERTTFHAADIRMGCAVFEAGFIDETPACFRGSRDACVRLFVASSIETFCCSLAAISGSPTAADSVRTGLVDGTKCVFVTGSPIRDGCTSAFRALIGAGKTGTFTRGIAADTLFAESRFATADALTWEPG